jgi:hypothetical protein
LVQTDLYDSAASPRASRVPTTTATVGKIITNKN